jgi:hypothetical protein
MVAFNKKAESFDQPPEHILEWCRQTVRVIADGGVWGIPRSGTVFRVDHKNKQLILISPGEDDGADYNATKHVFKFIGWAVVKEPGKNT